MIQRQLKNHFLGNWVIHMDGHWWLLDDHTLMEIDGLGSVAGPVRVLSDFGGELITAVETVNGPSSYAEPLIEKRLRETGVLQEAGRILIHASQNHGGATRVLYSAMPVETFTDYINQAIRLPDHCLVFSYVSAMYRQAIAVGGDTAVVFQHGRRLDVLMTVGRDLVGITHVSAFSTDFEDMETAVADLSHALGKMMIETGRKPTRILWFSLIHESMSAHGLPEKMAEMMGIAVEEVHGESQQDSDSQISIRQLVAPLRSGDSINGVMSRVFFQAEKVVPFVATLALAFSLALFGVSWHWSHRAHIMQEETRVASQQDSGVDLERLTTSLSKPNGILSATPAIHKQIKFLSDMNAALVAPDLSRIILQIREATPENIRIVGIDLSYTGQGFVITIDGVAQSALRHAVSDLQTLTAALRAQGYQMKDHAGAMDGNNAFRLTMMLGTIDDQV